MSQPRTATHPLADPFRGADALDLRKSSPNGRLVKVQPSAAAPSWASKMPMTRSETALGSAIREGDEATLAIDLEREGGVAM